MGHFATKRYNSVDKTDQKLQQTLKNIGKFLKKSKKIYYYQ